MSRMDKSSKGINKYYYSKSIVYPPPRQQRKLKKLKIYSPDLKSHIDLLNPPSGVAMGGPDPPLFFRTNFLRLPKLKRKCLEGGGYTKY
jgi:hypothetical protein